MFILSFWALNHSKDYIGIYDCSLYKLKDSKAKNRMRVKKWYTVRAPGSKKFKASWSIKE